MEWSRCAKSDDGAKRKVLNVSMKGSFLQPPSTVRNRYQPPSNKGVFRLTPRCHYPSTNYHPLATVGIRAHSFPTETGADPASAVDSGDRPARLTQSQPEGISITKVSRGDRRCTFPNELAATRLLSLAIAHVEEHSADTFFALANMTALGTDG